MGADGDPLPRVLFVIGSLEPGGSESQLVALLERIHGVHVDARLATMVHATDHRLAERIRAAGVPLVVLGPERNRAARLVRSTTRLARLIRSARPDLVYPWLEQSALLAAPVARVLGVPVMIARRNVSGPYVERPRPIVAAIHAAERLGVLATANSDAVAAETVRRGIPPARVRVIPNGYQTGSSSPLPGDEVVILGYVARMRPEKGHRRLFGALAATETDTPWRVDLAGDGPLQDEIKADARRLGLNGRVRFLGAVHDVPSFWGGCDAGLLLSDHEGSPNALIEAAGMGRPVLATAVGGIPEFVDDEVGILVSPDDPAGLVAALRRLIEDRALRERLGAAARRRVADRFSMERFVEGHCAAMREALELARQ
ncbi:MAG TPA: glycosyltransferase [Solirubrobacteraceae bacterium]|nr:glycosyltransferase [Solirubrobacteraceae bacterium]